MSNLERHPFRNELVQAFEQNVPLRQIVAMGLVGSKSVAHRLKREWEATRPSVPQSSRAFVQSQLRTKALKEQIEELLAIATRKNDLQSAVRLVQQLDALDRRVLSPASRRQESSSTPVCIQYATENGGAYPWATYVTHIIGVVGWSEVLRVTLTYMAQSDTLSEEIRAAGEKFLDSLILERGKGKDVADRQNPSVLES